jgi:hypothetical protein
MRCSRWWQSSTLDSTFTPELKSTNQCHSLWPPSLTTDTACWRYFNNTYGFGLRHSMWSLKTTRWPSLPQQLSQYPTPCCVSACSLTSSVWPLQEHSEYARSRFVGQLGFWDCGLKHTPCNQSVMLSWIPLCGLKWPTDQEREKVQWGWGSFRPWVVQCVKIGL